MTPAEHIVGVLTPGLGRFTADRAVRLAADACKKTPEELTIADLDAVRATLRPMLRTLVGPRRADEILDELDPERDGETTR